MVTRTDSGRLTKRPVIGYKDATLALEGSNITLGVYRGFTNDGVVTVNFRGLMNPHPSETPVNANMSDERVADIMDKFKQDFFEKLNLRGNPIKVGILFKTPLDIGIETVKFTDPDNIRIIFSMPTDDLCTERKPNELFDRIAKTLAEMAPKLETDIKAALQTPRAMPGTKHKDNLAEPPKGGPPLPRQ